MSRGWSIAIGVVMVILGLMAIGRPLVAAAALSVVLGWLLLIAGGLGITMGILTGRAGGWLWGVLPGALLAIIGFILLFYPIRGAQALAVVLGLVIIVRGFVQIFISSLIRPAFGWLWLFIIGVIGVVLGVMLIGGWPASGPAIIGLLVGIVLIMDGVWYIAAGGAG